MKKAVRNYTIYSVMILVFGILIYGALRLGETHEHLPPGVGQADRGAWELFTQMIRGNLTDSLTILLFQIIVILLTVRVFSFLFKFINQPGVIGEIVAGIVLGPSVLGYFFPEFFGFLFPASSLDNLNLLSQIGLLLFMFVIGMELDFGVLKSKLNETLVISHAGIIVPFFLGIVASVWVYEEYASAYTAFLPFALFIGISMSITAFPVLARIIQERGMTRTSVGILSIASAANDDVTAWCLLAVVIAIAKAGSVVSALFTVGLTVIYIVCMFFAVRPFLKKIGEVYATSEVIHKPFVGFIFLVMTISAITTEIIGIHALFGAFLAGVVMPPNMGFRKVMMGKVEDVALVFFLPLFFAFTGLRTQLGLINTPELGEICALFIGVAVLGKLGGCAVAARLTGESWRDSLTVGTLMNTRGLMELVALNIGYEMGVLPPSVFVILILMALITTFMTTPILAGVEKLFSSSVVRKTDTFSVMISFGRPESGRVLLAAAALLFGTGLKKFRILASHYTLGTDLNPARAEQYEKESFIPLESEARLLGVDIEKKYRVSDRITRDLIHQVRRVNPDFLLMGAGPRFLHASTLPLFRKLERKKWFGQLVRGVNKHKIYLPGALLREKLEPVIREVDCPVGIVVNRHFTTTGDAGFLLSDKEDFFLLSYVKKVLEEDDSRRIYLFVYSLTGDTFFDDYAPLNDLAARYSGRMMIEKLREGDVIKLKKMSMLILSYAAAYVLSGIPSVYNQLPSLLVIYRPVLSAGQRGSLPVNKG